MKHILIADLKTYVKVQGMITATNAFQVACVMPASVDYMVDTELALKIRKNRKKIRNVPPINQRNEIVRDLKHIPIVGLKKSVAQPTMIPTTWMGTPENVLQVASVNPVTAEYQLKLKKINRAFYQRVVHVKV